LEKFYVLTIEAGGTYVRNVNTMSNNCVFEQKNKGEQKEYKTTFLAIIRGIIPPEINSP
jgi:hypothetical protein